MTLAVIARGSGLRCVSALTMIPMPFPLRPARTVLRLTNTRCAAMRYRDGGEWPRPIIDPMKTRLLQADAPGAVEEAAAALGRGELVAFPTDTVYGLASGHDPIHKLYLAKDRPK